MRALGILIALCLPATARADEKIERADKLFAEGKALLATDLHGACAKFEESYALNPHAIGTLLNVARCDEKLGKLASASAKFALARDMASEGNLAVHRKAAVDHLAALAPRVPHVTIAFAQRPAVGITIVVDGKAFAPEALANVEIDPGSHDIVVSAEGYQPHRASFAVAEGEHRTVTIPALEKSVTLRSRRRTIGLITAGTGAAVGVTGIVIGLVARSRFNGAESCHARGDQLTCDDPADYTTARNARSLGNVGTVVGIAGGVAIGVGAVLWVTGRRGGTEQRVAWIPQVAPDGAGIAAVGRF